MHQDDKFYTFLLSHFNKTKQYVSRAENSHRIFLASIVGLFLIAGVFSIILIKNSVLAQPVTETSNNHVILIQTAQQIKAEYKSINYDRPTSSDGFTVNSGGPIDDLTENESEAEEAAMESQLRVIETTGNPTFLPTMWAHLGKINNEFGFRRNPFGGRGYEFHPGLDIDGERGDVVAAPANGIVTKAGWEGGYGNMIEIDHGNGLKTRYGHLSRGDVVVGDTIQRGQLIGLIGSTGRSTGPHLHYEVRLNDKPINPRRLLPPEPAEIKALNAE